MASSGNRVDLSPSAIEKYVGGNLKDIGYALGSGNMNSLGQSLWGGEGTVARKEREEIDAATEQAEEDIIAGENTADRLQRERIDSIGTARRRTPGVGATLLSQGYGSPYRGTLLTPRSRE